MGWIWTEAAGGTSAADSFFSAAYDDDHHLSLVPMAPSFFYSQCPVWRKRKSSARAG